MTSLQLHRASARARHRLVQCDGPRTTGGHAKRDVAVLAHHLDAPIDLRSRHPLGSALHRASNYLGPHRLKRSSALDACPHGETRKVRMQISARDRTEAARSRRNARKRVSARFAYRLKTDAMLPSMAARTEHLDVRGIEQLADVAGRVRVVMVVRLKPGSRFRRQRLSTSFGQSAQRPPYVSPIPLRPTSFAPIAPRSNQVHRVPAPAEKHIPTDSAVDLFTFHAVTIHGKTCRFQQENARSC